MNSLRQWNRAVVLLAASVAAQNSFAQEIVTDSDGTQYQVTRRVTQRQVPVTEMQNRQHTVYTQQLTTNTVNHQQVYRVPSTYYHWDTRLRGRWNPFVTPYWTYDLRPVTTWSTQVANVQIPVNHVAWVPQTSTVQVPVTTYRTAEVEETTRVAMNDSQTVAVAQQLPRSATIAARRSTSSGALGGQALENDPPRHGQATGWQLPSNSRYR
ncbi:MAG: hypothetical protein MK171_02615 [Pirellulales bacterium]|nr:hypothetical protein [Pirellulales bacterium]